MSLFKKHPLDLPAAVIAGGAAGIEGIWRKDNTASI